MPTGHGDAAAICRLEDRSRRRQPGSFLQRSGWRAGRWVSPAPFSVQARAKPLVVLPPMPNLLALQGRFAISSSCFTPSLQEHSPPRQQNAIVRPLNGDINIFGSCTEALPSLIVEEKMGSDPSHKQYRDWQFGLYHRVMTNLPFTSIVPDGYPWMHRSTGQY